MSNLFFALTIAFFLSAIITPYTIKLARKFNLLDDPKKRNHPANTHKGIIPRAGGLPIYTAIIITSIILLTINQIIFGVLLGGLVILIMGLLDDKYDLSPYSRFIISLVIIFLVVSFGLGVPYITNPLGGIIRLDQFYINVNFFGLERYLIISNLFSIIWIVFIMNIVNWSKGVDGQLPGFAAVSCFVLGLLALRFSAHDISSASVTILAFIVGGSYLGFLPWNFYPQKIMPGYSGGALAGYFLGVLSILSWGKIGTLVLLLTIPFIDAIYVISNRLKNKKSPFRGDAKHFHHRLLKIGWGRRRIAIFYWIVSLIFGIAALFLQSQQKYLALLVAFGLVFIFILIIQRLSNLDHSGQKIKSLPK